MRREQADIMGKLALGLCVAALALAIAVGILAAASPRSWTMRDAANTLMAGELMAAFIGALAARRSGFGAAAMIIGGVLALGAWIAAV
jgi:hypothetical protein